MGQKIKKILSSEKGSITMLAVAAMLFMIVILALSFMSVSNKKSAQMSNIKQIEAEYGAKEDIGEVYKEVIETSEIGKIRITPSTTEWTNSDVIVTIEYEKQLTENRKAGIGSANTPNATSLTVTENATVYAEAYTKDGHRKTANLQIKNIDKVKPTAVIRTNGGSYVMPTGGDKATIKTRVSASDLGGSELNELKYAWSQSKDIEPTNWQTFADGDTLTKNDCTVGTYYLWLNVTDHAGNRADTKVSNAFIVRDSSNAMDNITFKVEPDGWTNEDVKVTVIYGDNLTENRKAGPEGEDLKPNATIVTMTENGKVVAEAEDPAGNKVTASIDIDKIDKVPPVIKTVTNPSNGNWTKDDTTVTLVAEDDLSGIKEFQWFENGEWTTKDLTTDGNTGTITYTADRDTTIRFRVIDNAGNISEEKTTVVKIDKTAPTHTSVEVKNITTTGYDLYIYGVTDGSGSGVNRVQFPTWTNENWQDDIQSNWETNASATGVKQADGTTWVYRVNVTDHKNEYGEYITDIYTYDNIGNNAYKEGRRVQVPGVEITFNANGGTVTEGTRTKGYASQIGTLPTPTRNGYGFDGWYTEATGGTKITDATTVPADNVTYYAHWIKGSYTISYDLKGGSVTGNPTSYDVETETITLKNPTKNGYTFTGWTGSNGTTPQTTVTIPKGSTGNKSYTANWTATNYTITYDLNGGTITGNPENYNIESDEITLPTPTKTGYTFAGWTGSNGTTPQTTVKIPKGQTGNKNYTANWTANNYTLAYNANGGTGSMATDTIAYNTNYTTKANAFTRTGYTFKGWNEKADGTGTDWTSWIGKPWQWTYDRNVTLYAQWTRDTYTIEYNLNGGTITGQPTSYNVESNAITLPTPTKTGYTFTGWTGSNGTTPQKTVTIAKGSTGNKNYTANWTINNYTVTYDNNYYENSIWNDTTVLSKYNSAGTAPKSRTNVADANAKDGNYIKFVMSSGTSGGPYYAPAVELTSGKTYTWSVYIKASTNKKLNMGYEQNGQKDVNVTTNWQKVTHTFTATEYSNYKAFIFYAYGGWTDGEELYVHSLEIMEGTPTHTTASKQYNSTLGTLPAPTRTGYTFTGWYTEPVGGTKISDTTTVPANNVTYYAHWTTNTYTIGYNLNGGTANGPTSFNVGTETITLPTPTKNGYTFTGWTGSNGTTPQTTVTIPKGSIGDKSYTANWTATNYTISYNLNGGTITGNPGNYNIESNAITLPTPTKTGYTFTGWTGSNGTTPQTTVTIPKGSTGNKNYTANWSINSYHIDLNYTVDGTAYWSGYNSRIYVGLKVGGADKGYVQDYGGDHNYGTTWEIYGLKLDGVNVAYTASGTLGAGDLSLMRYFYTITINRNNTNYGTVSSSSVIVPNNSTTYSTTGNTLKLSDGRTVTATATAATGYTTTFSSWTPTSGTVNAATTVTANFTRTANPYTVTYNFVENGGKSATKTSATVNYGSAIDLSPTAAKDGYTFVGWNTNKDATTKLNSLNMGAGNVTLYAIYSKTLTGTFYYWDGSKTANKTASVTIYNKQTSGTITAPSVNAISGYTARGWSTSSAANATVISGNPTLSSDTNYYMSYTYTVTATYMYNNTSTKPTATAYMNYKGDKVGGTPTTPANPTNSGWTFRGWSTSSSPSAAVATPGAITADTTYYGSYSKTVTVTKYVYNNQSSTVTGTAYLNYANATTNASINLGTTTPPSGYTARGWSTSSAANATVNVALNGNVSLNTNATYYMSYTYTVTATYMYNNTSTKPTATAYMNYKGDKVGGTPTKPANPTNSGWTFRGWSTSSSPSATVATPGAITADTTYYGSYSKTVTATKYVYNNTSSTATGTAYLNYANATTNASINLGTTTPPSGYTARGWSTSSAANATVNVALNGNASINTNATYYMSYTYTVTATYMYNNTSTKPTATAYMNYKGDKVGGTPTKPANPTNSGWTFRGWSTSSSPSATVATPGAITADTTYYGSYSKTVTATKYVYNNQSSTATGTAYLNYANATTNASINLGTTTPPSGYTARGWSTSSAANATVNVALNGNASINTNTTYYMSYTYIVTATYMYNNTSTKPTATAFMNYTGAKVGGTPTKPANPTNSGWTFRGWSTSSSPSATVATPGAITADTTYYGSYSKTVTATKYVYNNTSSTATGTAYLNYANATTNASINLGTTTPPSGYTARGWSTSSAANATVNVALNGNVSINTNATYYMSYTYTVTATYMYNNTNTKPTATAYMNYKGDKVGGTPTKPANPTNSGWTFRGWSTSSSPSATVATPGAITANTTYYGSYSKTVTATKYVYNNQSSTATGTAYLNYANATTNASINLGTTSLSGYTARGWSTSSAANATVNVALNGNASINTNATYYMSYSYGVTLTYNGNGTTTGVPAAQSGTAYMNYKGEKVGATITLSTTKPTRTNYTFSGWYTATSGGTKYGTSTTINANTTIYAQWSGNVYTVTLNTQNATSVGSTAVYEKYGTGIYKELACTNQMTTSANAITKPSRSYTLTYNANGGTVSGTSTTASYTFGGYYTATGGSGDQLINANGNITSAFSTTKYSANGTLYAMWTRNSTTLATPTRAGYVFKGWFTAASGGTQITSASEIKASQTIYARWEKIATIEVGDYINYEPDSTSQTTYSRDNLVQDITGSTSNTADITRDNLKWQVLRIHDDGSMDLIGSPTSQNIYFRDATGYNNGVYVMHDICEKLYSRNGIKARSVTLEDMENWLTDAGKTAKSNYISNQVSGLSANSYIEKVNTENNTVTYKKSYSYYPNLYANENGSGINTETVKTDGIKDTNKAELDKTTRSTTEKSYKQADNLTTTQTYYIIPINSTNYGEGSKALYNSSNTYWVASRYVRCLSNDAYFGLRYARTHMNGSYMFYSNSNSYDNCLRLRPVVSLGSEVQVTASSTASSSTGTPHTITQY